jgi:hypothetical protein
MLIHDRQPAELDAASIWQGRAGGDGDQGRLTRAVLSDQRVDLSFDDLEADTLESDHARERLDDVRQTENGAGRRQ